MMCLVSMTDDRSQSPRRPRIVAIDDDPLIRHMLERLFHDEGQFEIATVGTGHAGIDLVAQRRPDVLILDQVLPDLAGLEVLQQVRQLDPQIPVILITAQGTSLTAIEAMKWGAFDYLPKPLDLPRLAQQVQRALEARRLMRVPVQRAAEAEESPSPLLVGQSPAMQEVYKSIGRVASQNMPVLLEGETGAGKELVARVIHHNSPRAGEPFLTVKCPDFSAEWLESELFGHEAGGLAGSAVRRIGKLEQAGAGTLLLEEIGELRPPRKPNCCECCATGEFERLGSSETLSAAVNVSRRRRSPCSSRRARPIPRRPVLPAGVVQDRHAAAPQPARRHSAAHRPLRETASRIQPTFDDEVPRVSPEALALLTAARLAGQRGRAASVRAAGPGRNGRGSGRIRLSRARCNPRGTARRRRRWIRASEVTNWRSPASENGLCRRQAMFSTKRLSPKWSGGSCRS